MGRALITLTLFTSFSALANDRCGFEFKETPSDRYRAAGQVQLLDGATPQVGTSIDWGIGPLQVVGRSMFGPPRIRLKVPRTQVHIPAWNPIDPHHYRSGNMRSPPTTYSDVAIGLDGHIYLMDGNHRFTLDTRRDVFVEIRLPLRTVTFAQHLDLIGGIQPSRSEVVAWDQGEISLRDILRTAADLRWGRQLILLP